VDQFLGLLVAAHVDRLAHDLLRPILRMIDRLRNAKMLHLRIREYLVDRVDGTARHAGLVQGGHPEVVRAGRHDLAQTLVQGCTVLRTHGRIAEPLVGDQIRRLGDLHEPLPQTVAGCGDIDVAVRRLEHARSGSCRMTVAFLPGHLALHEITRRLEVEHEDLCFD
jgi:hypothetical protein